MPTTPDTGPATPLPSLTAEEASAIHQLMYHLLSFVPSDHLWSKDEWELWDEADAAMRRIRGIEDPASEAT